MSKFILIGLSLVSILFFIGCSSTIQISKEDSEWIKEYIDYSNTYIESSFKDNPSDAQRRAIEPYRSRFRTAEKIVKEWNY